MLVTFEDHDGVPIVTHTVVPIIKFDMSHDHITLRFYLYYLVHPPLLALANLAPCSHGPLPALRTAWL